MMKSRTRLIASKWLLILVAATAAAATNVVMGTTDKNDIRGDAAAGPNGRQMMMNDASFFPEEVPEEPSVEVPEEVPDDEGGDTGGGEMEGDLFIINGVRAAAGEFPFFAHRYYFNSPAGCGGSLIAQNWVLTAAHCLDTNPIRNGVWPQWRVGSYCTIGDVNENCGARFTLAESAQILIHPRWDAPSLSFDFGLVRLDRVVAAIPVSIDDGRVYNNLQEGDPIRSIGMGWTNDLGDTPTHLQKVDNYFVPANQCRSGFESIMCTNGQDKGNCRGDSGSPNLVFDGTAPTTWRQVGLTSFGPGKCENHNYNDGLARAVAAYHWIVQNVCANYWGQTPEYCPPGPPRPGPAPPARPPPPPPTRNPTRQPTDELPKSHQTLLDPASTVRDIGREEFPWFTAIRNRQTDELVCSGALVGLRYVLTASHCVGAKAASDIYVTGGYWCPANGNCGRRHDSITVKTVHSHSQGGDVALLELHRNVRFAVQPAVPYLGRGLQGKQKSLGKGRKMTLVGAARDGGTSNDNVSGYVKKLRVKFLSRKKCRRRLASSSSSQVKDFVICSTGQNGSPCGGDDGSAVVVRGKGKLVGRHVILGIHNFGPSDCADAPYSSREPLGHFRVYDAKALLESVICKGEFPEDWCP